MDKAEIEFLEKLLTSRIDNVEKSIQVSHEDLVRVPTELQKQITTLRDLIESKIGAEHLLKEEKFKTVFQRFDLLEEQRKEQKEDTKISVDAALVSSERIAAEQNRSFAMSINNFPKSDIYLFLDTTTCWIE